MRAVFKFMIVVALVLCGAVQALAFGEIRYTDRNLNLRAARDGKAEWIGLLFTGQRVRVDDEVDGWVAVYEPDATDKSRVAGYANLKYLMKKKVTPDLEPWGEPRRARGVINIRREPSTTAPVVGRLADGQRVKVDFPEDDWVAVFSVEATIRSRWNALGFCMAKLLTDAGASPAAPAPAPTVAPALAPAPKPAPKSEDKPAKLSSKPWGRVLSLSAPVRLHANRTVESPVTRTLPKGERVKIGLQTGDWYAVFRAGEFNEQPSRALGYADIETLEGRAATETAPPLPAPEPAPAATPAPAPAVKSAPAPAPEPAEEGGKVRMVIRPEELKSAPRPAPAADSEAHGFRYKLLDQGEVRVNGEKILRVRVYLDVTRIPVQDELKDFIRTIWSKYKRHGRDMLVDLYVPDMDLDDIAYVSAFFDDSAMVEYWERRTALFGTRFQ